MSKKKLFAAVALVVAAVSLFVIINYNHNTNTLVMKNFKTGETYLEVPLNDDHLFSVSYTHSVSKSLVEEYYTITPKDGIVLVKARYNNFGAGVATELTDGQYLSYDDENYMVINNMHVPISQLVYKVGTVSDHILHIGDESWHLKEYAPELTSVTFTLK